MVMGRGKKTNLLSEGELKIMKLLWTHKKELSVPEIVELGKEAYGLDWSRNIVSTYLSRVVNKGYVESYKNGRKYYYHVIMTEDDYKAQMIAYDIEFYYHGSVGKYVRCILERISLTEEDLQEIAVALEGAAADVETTRNVN